MLIVAVQGGKGGILKTGTAELLCAWLDGRKITWRGADTDQENKSFFAVHSSNASARNVQRFDVYDREAGRLNVEQVNALVNDIDKARNEQIAVYVIDQGAGQGNVLRGAFTETGLIDEIMSGAIKLTVLFVTVNTNAALSTLLDNLKTTFDGVPCEWIIAKNEFKGQLDTIFTEKNAEMLAAVKQRDAKFIAIPLVPDNGMPLTAFENSYMPLAEFVKQGPFAERGRLHTWMRTVHEGFDRVAGSLGGADDSKAAPARANRAIPPRVPAGAPPISEVG